MKLLSAMTVEALWFLLLTSAQALPYTAVPLPPLVAAASSDSSIAPSPPVGAPRPAGCSDMCGSVNIPYPFGIGEDCAWPGSGSDTSSDFNITCNHSFNPPRPYTGDFEIISISFEASEISVVSPVSYICYNSSNTIETDDGVSSWSLDFVATFLISPTRNVFTGIGCDTIAFLTGREDRSYFTGCITSCESLHEAAQDGEECTGLGCCQTHIPSNLSSVHILWGNNDTYAPGNAAWRYSPCNFAFISEEGWYHFEQRDLTRRVGNKTFADRIGDRSVPMVLDWAIRNGGSCSACVSLHSDCVNVAQGRSGYTCSCSKGYAGNPYVSKGCTNINECNSTGNSPCGMYSICKDTEGDYTCKCKFNRKGDGKSEEGCYEYVVPVYAIATAAIFVAILLLVILLWFVRKERKHRLRRGFFDKNGGKLLGTVEINIYTEEQLEKITNMYRNPIGEGNFGNVFLGTTQDMEMVAVKRAIREDGNKPPEGGDFVDEILFQFQMRHKNLVRLVGCCLETSIPMLVFEFVSSGSLSDVLHGAGKQRAVSLLERLDIAIGSAEAVTYMHSHDGHHKRIHGDIKSGNILLDDHLSPKVSDFGSSKVVSPKSRYVRLVASDMNYVDPVYMRTDCFTEKSDVYSFGVVLLELITRKQPKYNGNNSLSIDFSKFCKVEGNGRRMYDRDIMADDGAKSHVCVECFDRIGALAVRCLNEDVDERPTMADVLEELKKVKAKACGSPCSDAS